MEGNNAFGWVAVGLVLGTLARAARWTTDGRFDWRKCLFECLAVPALGMIVMAVGTWQNIDPVIMGGVAAFFAMVGTAALEAVGINFLNRKIG